MDIEMEFGLAMFPISQVKYINDCYIHLNKQRTCNPNTNFKNNQNKNPNNPPHNYYEYISSTATYKPTIHKSIIGAYSNQLMISFSINILSNEVPKIMCCYFYVECKMLFLIIFIQMEIGPCPVLHPTETEFNDFYSYIHFLTKTYKKDYGMVKIVPPNKWKPQAKDYYSKLDHLWVKHPIEQNVQGRGGFYESKNIVQQKMTFKAYRKYAEKESQKVASIDNLEKQKMFWKTITYSPPIYGADLTGSLMDQNAGSWNLGNLNSILKYALTQRVKGVTEPYCYIGSWKAFFSWHKQDLDLGAINYIHEGAPKIWYSIASDNSKILQNEARSYFKAQATQCSQFLRHKTFLINPNILLEKHKDLKISRIEHHPGEIMIVFGGAYHEGFNLGFNIAEAVNYATVDWLGELSQVKFCKCFRKSVKGQIESILYNLQHSQIFDQLSKSESFKNLQMFVFQSQQLEADHQQMIQVNVPVLAVSQAVEENPARQRANSPKKEAQSKIQGVPKAASSLKIKKPEHKKKEYKKKKEDEDEDFKPNRQLPKRTKKPSKPQQSKQQQQKEQVNMKEEKENNACENKIYSDSVSDYLEGM